jgi:hypothetical protein
MKDTTDFNYRTAASYHHVLKHTWIFHLCIRLQRRLFANPRAECYKHSQSAAGEGRVDTEEGHALSALCHTPT